MNFYEKFIPNQKEFTKYYNGNDYQKDLYNLIIKTSKLNNFDKKFDISYHKDFSQEEIGSNPISLNFISFLINITKSKKILEIGTFIGLSTLVMAEAAGSNGSILTIEKYDEFADIAEKNFRKNNFSNINLIRGDALDILNKIDEKFDFIFLDGNKEKYHIYFNILLNKLNNRGILLIDDCLFCGDSLNVNPKTEKGVGTKKLLELVRENNLIDNLLLPLSNGMLIIIKK